LWSTAKTLAGATPGSYTSWALFRADGIQAETIVRETQSALDVTAATPTLFTLYPQEVVTAGEHPLGRCRLSCTTDNREPARPADNFWPFARIQTVPVAPDDQPAAKIRDPAPAPERLPAAQARELQRN
jgi:hypothetical protein